MNDNVQQDLEQGGRGGLVLSHSTTTTMTNLEGFRGNTYTLTVTYTGRELLRGNNDSNDTGSSETAARDPQILPTFELFDFVTHQLRSIVTCHGKEAVIESGITPHLG